MIAGALFAVAAAAQEPTPSPMPSSPPSVRVSGEASVTTQPDQAEMDVGVVTQAPTAEAAASQNAEQSSAVLAALRKALGSAGEVKTTSYSVTPNYRYPKEGGKPSIVGYTASNTVHVTASNLADAGKVVDAATQSGANTVHGLRFTLKDERAVRARAVGEAARDAKARAEAVAAALGLRIVRVLSVVEGGSVPFPQQDMVMAARAQGMAPATPVEPGPIEVRATVTLTAEITPR